MINHKLKNTRFYLNFNIKVYIYYEKLLFNIYKEKNSLFIYITVYIEFKILKKSMIIVNILISNKLKIVNFYNIFYASKLEYNLF